MKTITILLFLSLILLACGPIPTTTNSGTGTTTGTVKPPEKVINETPSESYTVYGANLNTKPLLSAEELKKQKMFDKIGDALKEPQNVYRLTVGDYESGFDLVTLTSRIGELYNLQELEIRGIFEALPKEIGKLTQLQKLKLDVPNLKKELPNEIANWKNLKELYILIDISSENIKNTISFSNLNSIKHIDYVRLEGKSWNQLPSSLGNSSIKELMIFNMKVNEIPESYANIKSLEKISISGLDNLTKIPKLPNTLKTVDFYSLKGVNDISAFTSNASNLISFSMYDCKTINQISNFPADAKLDFIYINGLANLSKLCSFDKMNYLKTISLNNLPLLEGQLINDVNELYRLKDINLYNLPKAISLPELKTSFFFSTLTINSVPNFKSAPLFVDATYDLARKKGETIYHQNNKLEKTILDDAFNFSQDLYFEFKDDVNIERALKTVKKDKVKMIFFSLNDQVNNSYPILLNQLNSFSNLTRLFIYFEPSYKFTEFDTKVISSVKNLHISTIDVTNSNFDFSSIKKFVAKFPNITEFDLTTRNTEVLNLDFNLMSDLKEIKMDGAGGGMINVANVPIDLPILSKCPNLESLDLTAVISAFPISAYNLNKLKTLKIQIDHPAKNYELKVTNDISKLKNLETLKLLVNNSEMVNSKLSATISPEINNLNKLKDLEITVINFKDYKNGQLSFVYPDGIEKLTKLENLRLNYVKSNPKALEKLNLKKKEVTIK
ncbi:MAG: hypothetical protein V4622_00620 [Bacteroidota bacterium]